jgi:hypothetical protein
MRWILLLTIMVISSSCEKEELEIPFNKIKMHYGDEKQLKDCSLELVVYKHEILGAKHKINKDGIQSKRYVDYDVTSIRKCEKFPPRVLSRILRDPYAYLAKPLNSLPFEEWILVKIEDVDGYGKVHVKPISIVSEHPDSSMRLH